MAYDENLQVRYAGLKGAGQAAKDGATVLARKLNEAAPHTTAAADHDAFSSGSMLQELHESWTKHHRNLVNDTLTIGVNIHLSSGNYGTAEDVGEENGKRVERSLPKTQEV